MGTLILLKEPMPCDNYIDNIPPHWNTSLLTDNNLETCEYTAMGFKQVYYFINNSYRRPIITVTGNFTCSPGDGMFVVVFQPCPGGTTCQDTDTCILLADHAKTEKELYHCNFICDMKSMNTVGVLVNLPRSDVSICEITVL